MCVCVLCLWVFCCVFLFLFFWLEDLTRGIVSARQAFHQWVPSPVLKWSLVLPYIEIYVSQISTSLLPQSSSVFQKASSVHRKSLWASAFSSCPPVLPGWSDLALLPLLDKLLHKHWPVWVPWNFLVLSWPLNLFFLLRMFLSHLPTHSDHFMGNWSLCLSTAHTFSTGTWRQRQVDRFLWVWGQMGLHRVQTKTVPPKLNDSRLHRSHPQYHHLSSLLYSFPQINHPRG